MLILFKKYIRPPSSDGQCFSPLVYIILVVGMLKSYLQVDEEISYEAM